MSIAEPLLDDLLVLDATLAVDGPDLHVGAPKGTYGGGVDPDPRRQGRSDGVGDEWYPGKRRRMARRHAVSVRSDPLRAAAGVHRPERLRPPRSVA